MRRIGEILRRLAARQDGQANLEYVLVLCAFGLPLIAVFSMLLATLAEHYRRIAFFEALPFP